MENHYFLTHEQLEDLARKAAIIAAVPSLILGLFLGWYFL